jgi:2-polyprenyl-3-methyl-5-hydroxy-6-metoxy-1,4-benzoquinol methylase
MLVPNSLLPPDEETSGSPSAANPDDTARRTGASRNTAPLKILVILANFGTKNDSYMKRLLDEYASMSFRVHPVLLTNIPKNLGEGVEVIVQPPTREPWAFPFPHKQIMADHTDDYDLFIYSEDDTLITERNINAFLAAVEVLREDEIAGFLRTERGADGETHFSTVHYHFHWDPASVVSRGGQTFAFFTNEHSACYILTRNQLKRAIQSGGFLVQPHQETYDLLVSAATDPYTQCGFKKLINISRIEDFILPHLPNKYVGKLGLRDTDMFLQLRALEAIQAGIRPSAILYPTETRVGQSRWSKSYYEPARRDVLDLIPAGMKRLLSFGCGWGEMEAELAKRGIDVTALPLDAVIGACAEARGLKTIYGDSETALAKVSHEQFDCILATDAIHRFAEPARILKTFASLLAPGGTIVATVPNLSEAGVWYRRIRHEATSLNLGSYASAGIHMTSRGKIRRWFRAAGLAVRNDVPVFAEQRLRLRKLTAGLCDRHLAEEFIFTATKV